MSENKLLCVDCYETLESLVLKGLTIFFCNNTKCRRFGVLTVGGLFGEQCERTLRLNQEETTA